ncbi:MAG TPA: YbfB/YjiJ family MFS transporter [Herpetosiphonaceae bacterium]|nr:YbfB/YjiJ family MFS transporter [Herpetosiphonaceae bacterium]
MSSPSANSGKLDTRSLLTGALQVRLGAAVGLGLAPFGYALLSTPMQRSLDWSYAQADQVNSANVLGHLIGSLAAGPDVARWHTPRVLRVSLLAVSYSLMTTRLIDHLGILVFSRVIAGAGAGLVFVGGACARLAQLSDLAIGVY